MGLDQYIYREKKDTFNKRQELKTLIEKIHREFYAEHKAEVDKEDNKVRELSMKDFDGEHTEEINAIYKAFAEKHADYYDKIDKLQAELDGLDRDTEELAYWRKFWTLQHYLARRLGSAENCEDSVLTKDNLKTITDDFEKAVKTKDFTIIGEFSERDLDDAGNRITNAKDIFNEILKSYDEDYVYYYHPWW